MPDGQIDGGQTDDWRLDTVQLAADDIVFTNNQNVVLRADSSTQPRTGESQRPADECETPESMTLVTPSSSTWGDDQQPEIQSES